MQALFDKTRRALKQYRLKGEEALLALEQGNAEAFLALMRRREAAYHNFRALDPLARDAGFDVATDPESQCEWQAIARLNERLAYLLSQGLDQLGQVTRKLQAAQNVTRAYHSGASGRDPGLRTWK